NLNETKVTCPPDSTPCVVQQNPQSVFCLTCPSFCITCGPFSPYPAPPSLPPQPWAMPSAPPSLPTEPWAMPSAPPSLPTEPWAMPSAPSTTAPSSSSAPPLSPEAFTDFQSPPQQPQSGGGLSVGVIAGIAVGAVMLLIIGVLLWWRIQKKRAAHGA
ncbi:unnamed protein product, partial [Closterium sp. Naga37s-1]